MSGEPNHTELRDSASGAPLTINRPELLREGSDFMFRELVHGLLTLSARHQQIRAGHARVIGLTPTNYTVLIAAAHLHRRNGKIRIGDIAEHLGVTNTHVSIETNALRKAGLMVKGRSADDSRVATISITEEGWQQIARLAPIQAQVNDVQFDELSSEEFDTLRRLVTRLVQNSDAAIRLQQRRLDAAADEIAASKSGSQ